MAMSPEDPSCDSARRLYYRVRCDMKVQCRANGGGGGVIDGRAANLSRGGVLLHTWRRIDAGTDLRLSFANAPFDIKLGLSGKAVWCRRARDGEGHHLGIHFVGLTPDQEHNVLALVGKLSGEHAGGGPALVRLKRYVPVRLSDAGVAIGRGSLAVAFELGLAGMAIEIDRECRVGGPAWAELLLETGNEPARVTARVRTLRETPDEHLWMMWLDFESFELGAREMIGHYLEDAVRLACVSRN